MSEKNLKILGWIGTTLSVIMYVSYIPQIMGNLSGTKTPFIAAGRGDDLHNMGGLRPVKGKTRLSLVRG